RCRIQKPEPQRSGGDHGEESEEGEVEDQEIQEEGRSGPQEKKGSGEEEREEKGRQEEGGPEESGAAEADARRSEPAALSTTAPVHGRRWGHGGRRLYLRQPTSQSPRSASAGFCMPRASCGVIEHP